MNKTILVIVIIIFVTGIFTVSLISNNFAEANSTKKIHFTKTLTSSPDPGKDHENEQLVLVLSPNKNTLYDGSITFSSSKPVQVAILHEINSEDAKGQPIWTVDEKTLYAISLIGTETSANSIEFTGAALALHSLDSKEFTATVSIDGWIRGQPPEVIIQTIELEKEPSLLLSRTNIPVTIPMHEGIFNGNSVFYIITDSSQQELADIITKKQEWKVEAAPFIKEAPKETLQKIFIFKNGLRGDGLYSHQKEIFSNTPSQKLEYSALNSIVEVTWKKGQNAVVLESSEEVIAANESGRVEFNEPGIVINTPQIIWPDGQMILRNDTKITDELPFEGGQIIEINKDEKTVTFVAHRGWGPDGKTVYHIITDATPSGPAEMMGVVFSPSSINLITNSTSNLFEFQNGIKGSGPLGFQPSISTAVPGNDKYSPIWKVSVVEWNNPENATILETTADIDSFKEDDLISVRLAHTMNSDHIVNYPIIDPFQ